jgi:pyruvate-formate lyase-activating enzyme
MPRKTVWRVNPFLHFRESEIYNPLSDSMMTKEQPNFSLLLEYRKKQIPWESLPPDSRSELIDGSWIFPAEADVTSQYYLKYASIETHTVCNQACCFCPVSVSPREPRFMPKELFDRIVSDLSAYRKTLEGVFLNNYNEPFCDKRIIDHVRTIKEAGLNPAILTNGTELTPEMVDAFVDLGGVGYLAINIASIQREAYAVYHGRDNCERVLRNLEYAKSRHAADKMAIVVLGDGGALHRQNLEAIRNRFRSSLFEIRPFACVDRAGYLDLGAKPERPRKKLCGCEEFGSRPLQHILINSSGKCLFCCQDYAENYVVGDLNLETVEEVLTGPNLSSLRAQAYGLKKAPSDFICRKCVFALTC